MIKQKKGFWLFIFSLMPGAGEMYMGFKKQGISIMTLFLGIFAFGAFVNIPLFLFPVPIIWFYSFFNVINMSSLSEEDFYALEDNWLFDLDVLLNLNFGNKNKLLNKFRNYIAAILILIGISILWNRFLSMFGQFFPDYMHDILWRISSNIVQIFIAILIIAFGFSLIFGKKKELKQIEKGDDQ